MSHNVSSDRVPVFTLGERIRKAREDQDLSQQQLADMLGVHRKTLAGWERNHHLPRYGDLMLISSITDVSLEWLAGELYRPSSATAASQQTARALAVVSNG